MRPRYAFLLVFALGLSPVAASAQSSASSGDEAYCAALSALAARYLVSNTGEGDAVPDLSTSAAIQDCRKGKFSSGIPVLEGKLRGNGFTLPKR